MNAGEAIGNQEEANVQGPLKETFEVKSFRKLPNPYGHLSVGDPLPIAYVMYVDVTKLPANIPTATNPRKQNLNTAVAKKIRKSLTGSDLNFYLLNRGLTISADSCEFDNYANQATVTFSDLTVHGDIDGGHTYKIILEEREKGHAEPGTQFVKLEILTGVENFFTDLAAARNTSVQVKDQSIAELRNQFDIIKRGIDGTPFIGDIYFEENDEGDINVADVLAILNMFDLDRYPGIEGFPKVSYTGKASCIKYYLDCYKQFGDSPDNPYVKMLPIMSQIFSLYDKIECNMVEYYKQGQPNGRYGATKGVAVAPQGRSYKARFSDHRITTSTPTGFLYPILGSLRAMEKVSEDGTYYFDGNPFQMLDKVGKDLVATTVERSRSLGGNPNAVGKDTGNWKTLYMTVAFAMISNS
ncbi:MAG: AIPR family protein [Coriobacteriaceae bacterium]